MQMPESELPPTPDQNEETPSTIPNVNPNQVTDIQKRAKGCLWGLAGISGCLIVLLAVLILPIVLGINTLSNTINSLLSIFNPQARPPIATVLSTQTLVNSVQPLGQLVSVSAQLAKADINIGIQQGALNSCGFSVSHVAEGTIEAGIDLTKFTEDAFKYDSETNTYTLNLPSPELTSCRTDFIRQYNRSFTTCAVDWDEARLLANYQTLIDFRDDSIEGGILQRAERETRLIIGNFIKLLTNSEVVVNFDQRDENSLPRSCIPEIPTGWSFNEENQRWEKG